MNSCRLSKQEFTRLMAGLCRLHRIAFAPELLQQNFPPDGEDLYKWERLLDAAERHGLSYQEFQLSQLEADATLAFPLVAFPAADALTETAPILILGVFKGKLRCTSSGPEAEVRLENADALKNRCQPTAWSFQKQPAPVQGADNPGTQGNTRPFGFAWFLPELLRHKKVWRDILFASLALQLVGLSTPLFTQVIIDKVIVHQTQSTLYAVGFGLALALIFSAAFTWIRQYLVLHTGNRIDAVLGGRVFTHLLRLPLPYFGHRPTGTLVARLNGIETIREFISGAAIALLLDIPFMTLLLAVMFWYSWQLTTIALGLLVLLVTLSITVTPIFRKRLDQQFLLGARNQAFITEYISGMETVKSLQLEAQLEQRYGDYLSSYLGSSFDTRQISNTYNTTANALEQLQSLVILMTGALLVMNNPGFTIGMLIAFQMFSARLSQPLLRLAGLYQEFQQASLAVKRLGDLMDAPAEPYTLLPSRMRETMGTIEINDISFRYGNSHPWLYRNLTINFKHGETALISGSSGCGKSTLAKLLLGFHRPQEGQILLDGQAIRYLSANELRQSFGVVPQETKLFAGTVFENLQMANPHAGFQEIVSACRLAEIHETIEALPNGYQTELGE